MNAVSVNTHLSMLIDKKAQAARESHQDNIKNVREEIKKRKTKSRSP